MATLPFAPYCRDMTLEIIHWSISAHFSASSWGTTIWQLWYVSANVMGSFEILFKISVKLLIQPALLWRWLGPRLVCELWAAEQFGKANRLTLHWDMMQSLVWPADMLCLLCCRGFYGFAFSPVWRMPFSHLRCLFSSSASTLANLHWPRKIIRHTK